MRLLVVGGTRSGKSAFAQQWAERRAASRLYVATCRVEDAEMAERVRRHREQRGAGWSCLEEPLRLPEALEEACAVPTPPGVVLLDCVGLWIANLMAGELSPDTVRERVEALARWLERASLPVAVVSPECGLGLVPMHPVSRAYRDALGLANQRLAHACDAVVFVACGLPLALKGRVDDESVSALKRQVED